MDSNIFKSLGILSRSNANVEAVEGDGTTVYYVDLFPSERAECPLCGARGAAHGYYFKKARMPSNRFHESAAYVRVPRFSCPNVRCAPFGKASSAKLAGIGKGRGIPMAVYAQIVLSLKEPKTVAAIAKEYKVSSALVSKDLDDVVPDFGRGELARRIAIDEFKSSSSHGDGRYPAIICDEETGSVIDVIRPRRSECLYRFFASIPLEEREWVEFLSSDMHDPYDVACRHCPPTPSPPSTCST